MGLSKLQIQLLKRDFSDYLDRNPDPDEMEGWGAVMVARFKQFRELCPLPKNSATPGGVSSATAHEQLQHPMTATDTKRADANPRPSSSQRAESQRDRLESGPFSFMQ